MFSIRKLCKNSPILTHLQRYKSKTHWAKQRKKTGAKQKALNNFDELYGSVFGAQWEPMREALHRKSKYVAVVNNYGDADETMEYLGNRGAHCLKKLMTVQQDFHNVFTPVQVKPMELSNKKMQEFASKVQTDEISQIYPHPDKLPDRLETTDITLHSRMDEQSAKVKESRPQKSFTLEESIKNADLDESRIIDPAMGLTSESFYQFVPATKLKGLEDWIPESVHYSYYSQGKDFPLTIELETEFSFPEHLKVYTYEMDSDYSTFPEPKRGSTGVFNYYPLDCGSVLTVLALCLTGGDRVLDLCAAPGGKTLVALQTLLPDIVVANDSSISRANRIQRILKDYLYDFETSNKWRERVIISRVDGTMYTDDVGFDKVLVDVPCTTDRHSLNEDDNNIFRPDRIKERLRIPELQSALLINALKLVKVGGAVVYSTCSLSPIQNDGVVHMALKNAFEMFGIVANVRDLTTPLSGFTSTLQLGTGTAAPKYGQLVLPTVGANFGPTYFARLVRVR